MRNEALPINESDPMDLPWNPPRVARKVFRPVCRRASLIAPSTASVPLLMKKLHPSSPGVTAASSFASAARQGSSNSWLLSAMRPIWSCTALTILG